MGQEIQEKILNYAYAQLDISHYLENFPYARRADLARIGQKERFLQLEKQLSTYEDVIAAIARCLDDYKRKFHTPESSCIETFEIMIEMFQTLRQCGGLTNSQSEALARLQKKFEVSHRLFDVYDLQLRRQGYNYQSIKIYALFSVVLNWLHIRHESLSLINTAIKLNDLILRSEWPRSDWENQLVSLAILLEEKFLELEYGKHNP